MRRKKPMVGKPISTDDNVVSIIVCPDGSVRVEESVTQDSNYGRRLAKRIVRSLNRAERSVSAETEATPPSPSTWSNFDRMLRSSAPRIEQSRPREIQVGTAVRCSPGRKDPKRGC